MARHQGCFDHCPFAIGKLFFGLREKTGTGKNAPRCRARFSLQPSLVNGVARAVELALTGVMDGRVVNIVDEAPTTLYEMASLVGVPIEPSAEPLTDPWMGRMDGSRSRALGFHPTVPTVYQAMQQGIL